MHITLYVRPYLRFIFAIVHVHVLYVSATLFATNEHLFMYVCMYDCMYILCSLLSHKRTLVYVCM